MRHINVALVNPAAKMPFKAHDTDAGYDLYSCDPDYVLMPKARHTFDTGVLIQLPHDMEAQIRSKSGLAYKYGIAVLNSPGTIDAGFRAPLKVILINHGDTPFKVEQGSKIAQMVMSVVLSTELDQVDPVQIDMGTKRGAGGLGSTGLH